MFPAQNTQRHHVAIGDAIVRLTPTQQFLWATLLVSNLKSRRRCKSPYQCCHPERPNVARRALSLFRSDAEFLGLVHFWRFPSQTAMGCRRCRDTTCVVRKTEIGYASFARRGHKSVALIVLLVEAGRVREISTDPTYITMNDGKSVEMTESFS